MRKPCVAGNWKMNKTNQDAIRLLEEMLPGLEAVTSVDNLICPPYTALHPLAEIMKNSEVHLGAQNVYWETEGAYTGEISPLMVAELADYVIIGHSERRAYFGETDQTVNQRLLAAHQAGIHVVLCVGETLQENEAGKTEQVVARQLDQGLKDLELASAEQLLIAYEPVWAIGTGKAATPEGANHVIQFIRRKLEEIFSSTMADQVRILYGGSVKPTNAASFFEQPDIDGALVGGASLRAADFTAITQAAADTL